MSSPLKQLAGIYRPQATQLAVPTLEERIDAEGSIQEGLSACGMAVAALEDYQQAVVEAETHTATAERYIDILEHGLEHHEYSPQLLVSAYGVLDDLAYLSDSKLTTLGLESYDSSNLETAYATGVEDFKSVIKQTASVIAETTKGFMAMITKSSSFDTLAKNLTVQADGLIADAKKAPAGKKVEVSSKGLKAINIQTGQVSDLPKQVAVDLKSRAHYQGTYIKELISYQNAVFKAAMDLPTDSDKMDAYADKILAIKHPASSLPTGIKDGSALLAQRGISAPTVISEKGMAGLKALIGELSVNHGIETVVGSAPSTVTVTRSDVEGLLANVKAYAAMLNAYIPIVAAVPKQLTDKGLPTNEEVDAEALKQATRLIKVVRHAASADPAYTCITQGHELARIGSELNKLCERAIKLLGKDEQAAA